MDSQRPVRGHGASRGSGVSDEATKEPTREEMVAALSARHGVGNLAGLKTLTVTLGNATYTLTPRRLADYAAIDQFIFNRRPNVLAALVGLPENLPALERAQIASVVVQAGMRARFITPEESADYYESFAGLCHQTWLAARENHPDLTLEQVMVKVECSSRQQRRELDIAIRWTTEADELKN